MPQHEGQVIDVPHLKLARRLLGNTGSGLEYT